MYMKKMKVVDKYVAVKALLNGEKADMSVADALSFIDERIAITEKKNASGNGDRKPTATQIANEGIKEQILAVLASAEKPMTNGEITKAIGSDQPNKVCQLVAQMLVMRKGEVNPNGKVVRTEEKGKAYFALAHKE